MYRMLIVVPLAALLLTACVVAPGPRGYGMVVAPALPVTVEIGPEPYFYLGVTTLERSGSKAAPMAGVEAKAKTMTTMNGIDLNPGGRQSNLFKHSKEDERWLYRQAHQSTNAVIPTLLGTAPTVWTNERTSSGKPPTTYTSSVAVDMVAMLMTGLQPKPLWIKAHVSCSRPASRNSKCSRVACIAPGGMMS